MMSPIEQGQIFVFRADAAAEFARAMLVRRDSLSGFTWDRVQGTWSKALTRIYAGQLITVLPSDADVQRLAELTNIANNRVKAAHWLAKSTHAMAIEDAARAACERVEAA